MTDDWHPTASLDALRQRAQLLSRLRGYFAEQGVLEVETPLLSSAGNPDPHIPSFTTEPGPHVTRSTYAPVIDYITALENPDANHSAQLLRFERWAEKNNEDLLMYPTVLIALKAYGHFAGPDVPSTSTTLPTIWQAEATEFRQTDYFKQMVRNNNILLYWQSAGFPDQCRALGEDDFECD